jgi:hypothetical protein
MSSMSSSTSSSSADASITVVIGSNAPSECLVACLEALEPQRNGVEVRVYEGSESPRELRERFSWADFTTSQGALVPHHWRDGIDAARGEIVALTIAPMVPAPDWVATLRRLTAAHDAVGGAIEPGRGLRPTDWGEYFCRYTPDMLPFEARDNPELPGDNAAFRRTLLESVNAFTRGGFWEPVACRELSRRGTELWHTPQLVVHQGRSAGFAAFCHQRLAHGRLFGQQRGAQFSRSRNALGVAAAPIVPVLMTVRVLCRVFARRRLRLRALVTLPWILSFNVVWAYAEARGHLDVLWRR